MEQPIILCGYGRVGRRILEYLRATGLPVILVDRRVDPRDPHLAGVRVVNGDFRQRDLLQQVGVEQARGILIVTSNDMVNISTALMVRSIAPDVRIVLRVFNENLISRLGHAIRNIFPLSTSALTAPLLAAKAITGQALGSIRLGEERLQIVQMTIPHDSPLIGQSVGQLEGATSVCVLAWIPAGDAKQFHIDVDDNQALKVGDDLALCGDPRTLSMLLAHGQHPTPQLLWAGIVRRNARAAWRTLREVDTAVKVCTGILFFVIIASVLVFHLVAIRNEDHRLEGGNSLYRTISLIATSGGLRDEDYPDELKVFASLLRLGGAALTAAFTAILTNYLVRASLRGALEVRRIPDGGHVVVVGLGSIGYRTVDELTRLGQRVVVIETNRENRFISTVRGRGIPVIVGDATIIDVLQQANSSTARAVVVATGDDLINLEISLMCREVKPEQRVVLLQTDQHLAQLLREAAQIRLAVSVPALAAPAFVAGLFGDRVQSVILLREHLLAVVDLKVADGDPHLDGQAVRALAIDWRLVPVAVIPGDGRPLVRHPMNARLTPGDRLVAIMYMADLENLLRRKAPPTEWAVDILNHTAARQDWVQLLVGSALNIDTDDAAKALEQMPLRLKQSLTRGQAEDLLAMLRRERIDARMEHAPPTPSTGSL